MPAPTPTNHKSSQQAFDSGLKMLGIAGPLAAEHRLGSKKHLRQKYEYTATGPATLAHSFLCFVPFIELILASPALAIAISAAFDLLRVWRPFHFPETAALVPVSAIVLSSSDP